MKEKYFTFQLVTNLKQRDDDDLPIEKVINILDEETNRIVGKVEMEQLFPYDASTFFDMCDCYSIELVEFAEQCTKFDRYNQFRYSKKVFEESGVFLIIRKIGIEKEYRGHGFMRKLFEVLNDNFEFGTVILLKSCPLIYRSGMFKPNRNVKIDDTNKLTSYYKKVGFKPIKKDSEFMYHVVRF